VRSDLLIRAHGVATRDEATWLESLGVGLISVVVGDSAGGRIVSAETARRVASSLTHARLGVEPWGSAALAPEAALEMGAAIVEVPWGRDVPQAWREALARVGLGWALVRVPADEDDDPSWIQSRLEEAGEPGPSWVEVEVCPSLEDGWSVLQEPSASELDAADLDALARDHAILYAPAVKAGDVRSIRDALPHARGFSFTLADPNGRIAGAHRYSERELHAVLEQLRLVE
jgi:hypothetical protein